jgi:sugar O-acyltransferase (sialic acid O-acetyltransferase NeuD family)
MSERKVLVLGAGGHARVIVDTLKLINAQILGITEANPQMIGTTILGVEIIGGDEVVDGYSPSEISLVNGIGSIKRPELRMAVFKRFSNKGYTFRSVIHPSAIIAENVKIGSGVQIMAGCVLQTGVIIGDDVIINTKTSVDHDCVISGHSHIAPGCTLSGEVNVGSGVHVGSGTTIIQKVNVGSGALIGAGSVVLSDVSEGKTVFGVPAKVK